MSKTGVNSSTIELLLFFQRHPFNSYYPNPTCTAQYVARDIILTALHCVAGYDSQTFQFSNCKAPGTRYNATIISQGPNDRDGDWALLRVQDSAGFSDDFFDVSPTTPENTDITSVGWGSVRPLSDQELEIIKSAIAENSFTSLRDVFDYVSETIGIDIYEPDLTGKDNYPSQLKVNNKCAITGTYNKSYCEGPYAKQESCQQYSRMFEATCYTQHGNSGGPYFLKNTLYGVVSRGLGSKSGLSDLGFKTSAFYDNFLNASATFPGNSNTTKIEPVKSPTAEDTEIASEPTVSADNATIETVNIQDTDTTTAPQTTTAQTTVPSGAPIASVEQSVVKTTVTEEEITAAENAIMNEIQNIDTASLTDVLNIVLRMSDVDQLRKEYEAAKNREQSTANKMLGGLAIGAGGIGGMMLAQSMAEQSADEAAERDMAAYLATMHCNYASGKNIQGGETAVELPGGNDLAILVTEYKALAADLKVRKTALDMRPGIESETVLDNASSGLYDDVAVGKTDGAYTSISRALMDENSLDAAEWTAQKKETTNTQKTGGIIGGAGIVGGAAGNLIINRNTDATAK